jgi:KaiC/GvpD/RAD55 family RecA-like ATPase
MAENKWTKQLKKYDDAVDYDYDSFAPENCIYTPSPYFNWIFANKSHGIPKNSSVLFYGENKTGKSLCIYSIILELQRRDPEAICIYFNTELRGALQHNVFPGLDRDRLVIFDTNNASEIYDRVNSDIKEMVDDGMPLRLIAIDSLTNIQGIKREAADSVTKHLMGDRALTNQTGLGKLVPFCKRNKIVLLATDQMRANMDAGPYSKPTKAASSWATKHAFEFMISLSRSQSAENKVDIEGNAFEEDIKDAKGNKLITGHKVFCRMEGNSIGPQGRSGFFTLDYDRGIINQHEEIFLLGKATGVIGTESNNRVFTFGDKRFVGKKECAFAIRDDKELADAILAEVKKLDADL